MVTFSVVWIHTPNRRFDRDITIVMNELQNITPTVSVIIASYNQGCYIEKAIHSVLSQHYQDFEIIVIDDGSRDQTLDVLARLKKAHTRRIHILLHPGRQNLGITETYRLGIRHAKGKYLAFLEADDWWHCRYLIEKVLILDREPRVGLVFSRYRTVTTKCYGWDMALRQWLLLWSIPRKRPFNNFQKLVKRNNIATFSSFVVRKSELDDFVFPESRHLVFLDWLLLVHVSKKTFFYLDDTSRVFWRQHKNSIMGSQSLSVHQKRLVAFMRSLHLEINVDLKSLNDEDRDYFLKKNVHLAYFADFYVSPTLWRFALFFLKDPLWAVEALGSLVVNRFKLMMPG